MVFTSTNAMVKKLSFKIWKKIHYLIYIIAPLAVLHFYLLKKAFSKKFCNQLITGAWKIKKTKTLKKSPQSHQSDMLEQLLSEQSIEMRHFIQQQQQQANSSQSKHPSLHLPLSLLPRLVNDSSISLMKAVMGQYPHLAIMNTLTTSLSQQTLQNSCAHQAGDAPSAQSDATYNQALLNIETKLYLMGQMYHLVLCVFLLCQCKSRKSLNPQITLQDLADAINQYIEAHRTQLQFLTRHNDLYIEPTHVALAALAMDWQVGKQTAISKRTITISSQNPITGG